MSLKKLVVGVAFGSALVVSSAYAAEGPFTQDQLTRGLTEYNTHCRTCHAKDGKGALGPALYGEPFKTRFGGGSVSDLRSWVHANMPQTAPGSLKDEQLDPLIAYILSLNGYTPGQTPMSADAGKSVTIEK